MLGRRRRVKIHQFGDAPTLEGIYAGRYDGHYRLLKPILWESSERSHDLSSHEYWVPRERVVFVEVVR